MKVISYLLLFVSLLVPSPVGNSYIVIDKPAFIIIEGGIIYILHEELKEGKLW